MDSKPNWGEKKKDRGKRKGGRPGKIFRLMNKSVVTTPKMENKSDNGEKTLSL